MKNLICSVLLAASFSTHAQVEITSTPDGEVWVGYLETVTFNKDGVYMMVGHKIPGQNEKRMFAGVEISTCQRGFGSIYTKDMQHQDWEPSTNVSLRGNTVGDHIASALCIINSIEQNKPRSST